MEVLRPRAPTFSSAAQASGLFVALTLLSAWPLLSHFGSALPSDLGDPALNTWILWWNTRAVPLTTTWWNAPMFVPAPNAFALSESLLGLAPLTTPLIWAGVSPVSAYNSAFLLAGPLSALGAYLLAWRLTGRCSAAMVAGLAFGFSPYRIAQLPHLQMLWACWPPLALYALHGYVDTGRRRWLAAFGIFWLFSGLTNGYFLVFFPVLMAVWLLWFVRERRQLLEIGTVLAAASLPLLPLLLGYQRRQRAFGLARGIDEVQQFSADVTALLATSPRNWLSHHWTMAPRPEGELYPGLAIMLLAAIGVIVAIWSGRSARPRATTRRLRARRLLLSSAALCGVLAGLVALTGGWEIHAGPLRWSAHHPSRFVTVGFWCLVIAAVTSARVRAAWRRRSSLAFYSMGAAIMFLMALGPSARAFGLNVLYKAPYAWLMEFPGGDSMRVPARFAMLMILCLSVAGALAWARLTTPGRRGPTWLMAAAILCEGWIFVPVAATPPPLETPSIARSAAILELPMDTGYRVSTRSLLHAIDHGHPLINGFSGYEPPHFPALRAGLMSGDDSVFTALRTFGPIAVFIDATDDPGGDLRVRLAATPDAQHVATTPQGTWFAWPSVPAPAPALRDPELTPIRSMSMVNPGAVAAMFDGDLRTRWHTDGPQQAGTSITLTFDHAVAVSVVEMNLGPWVGDFPIELEISVPTGNAPAHVVWRGSPHGLTMLGALRDPIAVPIVIPVTAPVMSRTLTLTARTTDPKNHWSVAELRVFGR